MTRATIAGLAFATVLVLLALAVGYRALEQAIHPAAETSSAMAAKASPMPPARAFGEIRRKSTVASLMAKTLTTLVSKMRTNVAEVIFVFIINKFNAIFFISAFSGWLRNRDNATCF